MSAHWHLSLRQTPALRVDCTGVTPEALAACASVADVEAWPLAHGTAVARIGDFFKVRAGAPAAAAEGPTLTLEGGPGLARFDRIGWQMAAGALEVHGDAGHYAGGGLRGGQVTVHGHALDLAGCDMSGGRLHVRGNVGHFAAGNLPGAMDGMRGGEFIIDGDAGDRLADRMRRGTLIVRGRSGAFAASRLVAGTVVLCGGFGPHLAYGMRRGSLLLLSGEAGAVPELGVRFVPAGGDAPVFWQLLARDLQRHGGALAGLARRGIERVLGDVTAQGKGEVILPR